MRRIVRLAVFAILGVGALTALYTVGAREPEPPKLSLHVDVTWSPTHVRAINNGAAAGQTITIYINGAPPSGYKAVARLGPLGEPVNLELGSFVDSAGRRFNPLAQTVTEVWVGAEGFDLAKYSATTSRRP